MYCKHTQVGLLNVDGYYNSLLSFVDKAVDEGFISPTARRIILSAPTAKQLVRQLEVSLYSLYYTLSMDPDENYIVIFSFSEFFFPS